MAGIDRFLSNILSEVIKRDLEPEVLAKIERKLFLECGMSVKLSVEHFEQFLNILKKNSAIDVKKFQNDCINQIVTIEKLNDKYSMKIIDDSLSSMILQLVGDSESRKILVSIFDTELPIPNILKKSQIPKTSGYRKIEDMILNGMIIETGRVLSDSKKISKFKCCFDEIKVSLNSKNIEIRAIINKSIFEKSTSVRSRI